VVLASDVFYEPRLVPMLIHTLLRLADKDTLILISFEAHSKDSVELFYELAQGRFIIEEVRITL
jgi:hypothetical protein